MAAPTAFTRAEAAIGYGKRLQFSDAGSTWNTLFGTVDVQLPERDLGEAELTNDDSPDFHKDYLPGLFEPGEVSGSYRYTRSMYAHMESLYQRATVAANRPSDAATPVLLFWKCTLTDGAVATWRGFIKTHNLPTEIEGVLTVEFSIKVSGKMTFATSGSMPQAVRRIQALQDERAKEQKDLTAAAEKVAAAAETPAASPHK
jgi:hypothetical protein